MLVTLARASLVLSSKNVAAEAFDGLSQYSHCWLIYVFHENTDLPGLWKQPPHKDFKAKVMEIFFYQVAPALLCMFDVPCFHNFCLQILIAAARFSFLIIGDYESEHSSWFLYSL
jgi:hypothetical protein